MKKIESKRTRITLDEARKMKGKSNLAKIVAEQKKEQRADKKR
jgi:hypothetical protein